METTQDQVNTKNPAFPFKSWLAWFFLLLLPPAVVLVLLILDQSSFPQSVQDGSNSFISYTILILPFLAASIQWLYLRTRLPHALFWLPLQILVYYLVSFGLGVFVKIGFYNFSQNFSNPERFNSYCRLMLIFLLPGALLHFAYFRVKRVQVSWPWFRDYALVFALGVVGYLFYDALRFGIPPFIPGFRGQHYFDLTVFILYTSAGVAWVMARVPFPGVVKLTRDERPPEKYLQNRIFKRFIYWLAWLFPSGIFLFVSCASYLTDEFEGIVFAMVVSFSIFFFLAEWWCLDRLAPVAKRDYIFSALIFPVVYIFGWVPALQNDIFQIAMLLLACLAVGLFQQAGLRRKNLKINRYFFLYFFAAFSVCMIPVLVSTKGGAVSGEIPWGSALIFPIIISFLLALFIHPGVFQQGSGQVPLVETSHNQLPVSKEK